jgi:hypothetical protein
MGSTPTNFTELVQLLIGFINLLVPVLFALTILYLSWGIIKAWIINGGDQGSVDDGKKIALAGVVALVFMVGIWGILAVLQRSLGL